MPHQEKSLTYTEQLSQELWSRYGDPENDIDIEKLIDFLNSDTGFRTFGDGLLALMRKKHENLTDPITYLKSACINTAIELNEIGSINTLKNWFYGDKRPKKGELDRIDHSRAIRQK